MEGKIWRLHMSELETDTDIARLREDLRRVRGDLSRIWTGLAGSARLRLAVARNSPETACTAVKTRMAAVNSRIDQYPSAALLAAFGFGLLLSRVVSRPRR
jgi:hypothetical protein